MRTDFTQNPFDEDYFGGKLTSWKDEIIGVISILIIMGIIIGIILLIK